MKFVKVLLIFVAVMIVLLGILLFAALQMIKPEKIKGIAEDRISAALQRPTTIQKLDVALSLATGLSLEAKGVEIKGLFNVDTMQLGLDAKRFVTTKEIVIPKVIIERPLIEWTPESTKGILPTEDHGERHEKQTHSPQIDGDEIPEFSIKEIVIRDGQLHFKDTIEGQLVDITVTHLNLNVRDFGFNRSFSYSVQCALFSGEQSLLDLKGQAMILANSQRVRLHDMDLTVWLKNLDWKALQQNFPQLEASGVQRLDDGVVNVQLEELQVDAEGLHEFETKVKLTNVVVKLAQLPTKIAINTDLKADQTNIQSAQFSIDIGQGRVRGNAQIMDYLGNQNFEAKISLEGLQIADVADLNETELQARALLNGDVSIKGEGFELPALEKSLQGAGQVQMSDAHFVVPKEKNVGQPLKVSAKWIDLKVDEFAMGKSFPYRLQAVMYSGEAPLFDVNGQANIQIVDPQYRLHDLDLKVFLKNLDLAELQRSFPELEQAGIERLEDGLVHVKLPELALDTQGLKRLIVTGTMENVVVKLAQFPHVLQVTANVSADQRNLDLTQMTVLIKEGAVKGKATIKDYLSRQEFTAEVVLVGLQLADLVDLSEMDFQMMAFLNGDLKVNGLGFDQAALKKHLQGQAQLRVREAQILDFNLLSYVMTQLPGALKMPGLSGLTSGLQTDLQTRYKDEFEKKDTVFEVTDINVHIGDGRLKMEQTDFGTEGYMVRTAGELALDGQLTLPSAMFVTPELSQRFVSKEKMLENLQDATGRIHIPFKTYVGPVTKLGPPKLDIKNFTRQVIETRGKQELKNVLRKALDLDDAPAPNVSGTVQLDKGDGAVQQPMESQPEDVIIDVLDGLLQKL